MPGSVNVSGFYDELAHGPTICEMNGSECDGDSRWASAKSGVGSYHLEHELKRKTLSGQPTCCTAAGLRHEMAFCGLYRPMAGHPVLLGNPLRLPSYWVCALVALQLPQHHALQNPATALTDHGLFNRNRPTHEGRSETRTDNTLHIISVKHETDLLAGATLW